MNKLTGQVLISLSVSMMIFGLISCDRLVAPSGYLVERVSDGDTLVVKDPNGENFKVRLACVDAPEIPHTKKQKSSNRSMDRDQFSWGVRAQTRVQQLVDQGGNRVSLKITGTDRYGRKVAEVRLRDGTLIQQVLLQEGLAKIYHSYLTSCPSKDIVQQAEAEAQQQHLGIWGDSKFVNPWEYRSLHR